MSTCRSCGAEIIWAQTDSGKAMPMDAEPVLPPGLFILVRGGSLLFARSLASSHAQVPSLYQSHFATCPNADEHRQS